MSEFEAFPKIPRMKHVSVTITEKIDGTNAQIFVPEDPAAPVRYGSRNRWVSPGADNYGFATWASQHEDMLRRLGPGRHFGEWWGAGIQRGYGLAEKRLSLFQAHRWLKHGLPEGLPDNVGVVPILWCGSIDTMDLPGIVSSLFRGGSVAVPGWDKPEGVVVEIGANKFKVTDAGDQPKWLTERLEQERMAA